ncbi:MAG: DUF4082 domain-containing protein, partial [Candidatus Omnitrophota bacterium]
MRRVLLMAGIVVLLVGSFCSYLSAETSGWDAKNEDTVDVKKLLPELCYENEEMNNGMVARSKNGKNETISSKIKHKTGKNKVLVEKNKLTGTPHRIIGGGLKIIQKDKNKVKEAMKVFKSIVVRESKQKIRKKDLCLTEQQKIIDETARSFIEENKDILKAEEINLKLLRIQKVRNKAYINYQQYYRDIPVFGAVVNVIINEEGSIPSCGSDYHKDINLNIIPNITENQAMEIAKEDINFNSEDDTIAINGLFVLPLNEGNSYSYHLAYKIGVFQKKLPAAWIFFIDARTKEILVKYNDIKYDELSGKVTGEMLPEYYDEIPHTVPFQDEYLKIVETNTQTTTDVTGDYTFYSFGENYTLSTSLTGPWINVINDEESTASYLAGNLSSPNNISWNASIATQAEMNVFYHINRIHDYVKNILNYDGMDVCLNALVNKSYYANAYWDEINNELAFGDGAGVYRNFGLFSDVIYHEYTHGVTDFIYTDGGVDVPYSGESGAIHEGLSDYFACTINEDSIQGDGGLFIVYDDERNLDNELRYPDDWAGEVHYDGMIISGAFWDLRKNLIQVYGEAQGKTLADELIHCARFGYPLTFSEYCLQILIVDDDDGDVFNGTPHKQEIVDAFYNKHGIYLSLFGYINSPGEGDYVKGEININGTAGTYGEFDKYEGYCWKENLNNKLNIPDYCLGIYTVPVNEDGVLFRWNTAIYEDGIYCLGLCVLDQQGREENVYIHDVFVDNENSLPVLNEEVTKIAMAGIPVGIKCNFVDIDDPDGPFANDITYTARNLLEGMLFDSETQVYSWIPQISDIGETYTMFFDITDGENSVTQKVNIVVADRLCLSEVAYDADQRVDISGEKVVFTKCWWDGDNYYSLGVYDLSSGTEEWIVSAKQGRVLELVVDGDNVIWNDMVWGSTGRNGYMYLYNFSAKSQITVHQTYGMVVNVDIHENTIVWRDDVRKLWKYDIPSAQETKLISDLDIYDPVIYLNNIAMSDYSGNIWLYNLLSNTKSRVNAEDGQGGMCPDIYKNTMVVKLKELYMYGNLSDPKVQLTNGAIVRNPVIYGDNIVWIDERDGGYNIYAYNLLDHEEMQVTNTAIEKMNLVINGDKIAWVERGFENDELVSKTYLVCLPQAHDSFDISLTAGWNFISLPIEPLDSEIESVLAPISGKYDRVISFTSEEGTGLYSPSLPPISNTLHKLHAGQGYKIFMTEPATLTIRGDLPDLQVPVLSEGYNWVGLTALLEKQITDVLDLEDIEEIYTLIPGSAEDTMENRLYYPYNFTTFIPGTGYIVKKKITQTPWKNNENGTLYTNQYWGSYTMGYRFTPNKNGKITKLGGYFNGAKTVYLWDANKNLITSAEITSNNNWSYVNINPVQVTAGQTYTVAVYLPGPSKAGSYRYNIANLPQTYGDITIKSSGFYYGGVGCPTTTYTFVMYGQVDIGF